MNMQLHTDGGARGNPGPAGAGVVLSDSSGNKIKELGAYLGECTNNEAEYRALILGLNQAIEHKVSNLACFLDSELIVRQLNGIYKVKNENMKKFWTEVKSLEKHFDAITYTHVRREKNKDADKLVNEVLDAQG